MAPTLVATAGSASANSFATQAEGDSYADTRLNSSVWTSAAAADKDRALIEATRELNVQVYTGWVTSDAQALVWPRQFATDPDSALLVFAPAFAYFATDVIPQRVKDATCELALQFLVAGTTDIASIDTTIGVIEQTVDVLTTRWQPFTRPQGLKRWPRVYNLVRPLLGVQGASVPMIRG